MLGAMRIGSSPRLPSILRQQARIVQSRKRRVVLHTHVMWIAKRCKIEGREGETVSIADDARTLTMGEVIALWRDDEAFRDFYVAELVASPYEAFFWEMPPLDSGALTRRFECAILESGALARMRADDSDF
jgi:hypothetical protein